MIEDISINYEVEVKRLELILNNINKIGIDTSFFHSRLEEIKRNTTEKIEKVIKNNTYDFIDITTGNVYRESISELNKLYALVSQYNLYFQTMKKCEYIDGLNENEIDREKLENIIKEVIDCLKLIRNSNSIVYDEKEEVVKKLYDTVYKLMKLEFRINQTNKLQDYCKDYPTDSTFISELILQDIESLETDGFDVKDIRNRINYLDSLGKDNMYLDESLIRLIVISKEKEEIRKDLELKIDRIEDIYSQKSDNIRHLKLQKENLDNSLVLKTSKLKKDKKSIKKRMNGGIVYVSVYLIAFFAISFGFREFARVISRGKEYCITTTKYSTLTEKETSTSEYSNLYYDENDFFYEQDIYQKNGQTLLTIYYPWEETNYAEKWDGSNFKRIKIEYDLSDFDIPNIKNYLNLDLDKLETRKEEILEYKPILVTDDLYENPFIEIIKAVEDYENYIIENNIASANAAFYAMLVILTITASICETAFFRESNTINYGILNNIVKIKQCISQLIDLLSKNKNEVLEITNKIKELVNELNELIKENEKLEHAFYEIYNNPENKKLMDGNVKAITMSKLIDINQVNKEIQVPNKKKRRK